MNKVYDIIGQEVRVGDYVAISRSTGSTQGTALSIYKVEDLRQTNMTLVMDCSLCVNGQRWSEDKRVSFRPLEWQTQKMIRLTEEQAQKALPTC